MTGRGWILALLVSGGLAAAAPASAQFVHFTRCRAAYPCNRPFGLQYRPDPLIAGPYASAPTSAVSAHVELKEKLEVELDKPAPLPLSDDAVEGAVRAFLRKHPVPRRAEEKEKP